MSKLKTKAQRDKETQEAQLLAIRNLVAVAKQLAEELQGLKARIAALEQSQKTDARSSITIPRLIMPS